MQRSFLHFLCLLLVSGFCLIGCQSNSTENNQVAEEITNNDSEVKSYDQIKEPFENIKIEFQNFNVNASNPQIIELENGTSIEIPSDAFVDANGNPIQGEVEVNYREFHTAADVMASGIPMKVYSEDGKESWMQTAGMFEIRAEQNGASLNVAEGKEIVVNMASHVDGEYDFWEFNEEVGNWAATALSNPKPNLKKIEAEKQIAALNNKRSTKPVKPFIFDPKKPVLNFNINYEAFPELQQMNGIVWQFNGNDEKLDPINNKWIFKEEWDFVDLKATTNSGTYEMILKNDEKAFITPVSPSQQGKNLEAALALYEERLGEYERDLKDKTAQKEFYQKQAQFVRSMGIQGMGIYNYDILIKDRNNIPVLADFDFGNDVHDSMKKMIPVYLITGEGRSIIAFPMENWDRFTFDPDMDNRLVAVLPGNKLAYFSQKDFLDALPELRNNRNKDYVFKMNIMKREAKTIADIADLVSSIS